MKYFFIHKISERANVKKGLAPFTLPVSHIPSPSPSKSAVFSHSYKLNAANFFVSGMKTQFFTSHAVNLSKTSRDAAAGPPRRRSQGNVQ